MELIPHIVARISAGFGGKSTTLLLIILASAAVLMIFLLLYILFLRNYFTNTDDFFKRRLREMRSDGMIKSSDSMLIPVIHGKKTIIPLEPGELLLFYQKCHYHFFRLTGSVRNINIDLLLSDPLSIKDFENIGRGRIFFTSSMLIFENVRSRNKIKWIDISEIKVKFDMLILFDREGCHAFSTENPEILSDFIYNVFLKDM